MMAPMPPLAIVVPLALAAGLTPPVDYVASKFADHPVVILGEAHWVRHDLELVRTLIAEHGGRSFDLFASELYPASMQPEVDRVTTAESWDPAQAMAVLRRAAWPYRGYLEVLHEVWRVNRSGSGRKVEVLALGPGDDWRERLLPSGVTYDSSMARRLLDRIGDADRRVLVEAGFHHAFTRYHQPDAWRGDRALRFMDRMGNVLWRALGQRVFMIALHPPFLCRDGEAMRMCLPVDGAIDCAALARGGEPAGFDLAGTPLAELPVRAHYATGYHDLRLHDLADGWIWQRPPEGYRGVEVIPLDEFAPDDAALAEVLAHNPFSDAPNLTRADLERLWAEEAAGLVDLSARWKWAEPSWRSRCGAE
jgi:hypothetical protein